MSILLENATREQLKERLERLNKSSFIDEDGDTYSAVRNEFPHRDYVVLVRKTPESEESSEIRVLTKDVPKLINVLRNVTIKK